MEPTPEEAARTKWLNGLKPGDHVAYHAGYGHGNWHITRVEKRTKSGWIVTKYYTFNADGTIRGWESGKPQECEPVRREIQEEIQTRRLVQRLSHFPWHLMGLEFLQSVDGMLPAIAKSNKEG